MIDTDRDVEATGYFPGDTGRLDYEARKALVQLLRKTYISSEADPQEWHATVTFEDQIRERLNDMFLELRVDRQREIALKWQVPSENGDLPSLIRPMQHSREQAAVMLIAREELLRVRTGDTDDGQMRTEAWLDIEDIVDTVMTFPALADNQRDRAAARATTAVEQIRRMGILLGRPDATRLQVSPVVEILLPIERLMELTTWFREATTSALAGDDTVDLGMALVGEEESA